MKAVVLEETRRISVCEVPDAEGIAYLEQNQRT
jgi:hypothetical protein